MKRRVGLVLAVVIVQAAVVVAAPPPTQTTTSVDSAAASLAPQRDIMDLIQEWILKRRVEPEYETNGLGLAWSVLPTLSYNPVFGWALGASVSGAGRLGKDPSAPPSALSVSGNYSTTGQLQLQFKSDLFLASGEDLLRTDVRYLDTERSTWGLGPIDEAQDEFPMSFNLVRIYVTGYRRIAGVYAGLGFHYDDYQSIQDERAGLGESTPFTEYYDGDAPPRTSAAGFSINLLDDSRDSLVNPTRGSFLSGSFRDYLKGLGSDGNWQELWTELRLYPHLPVRSRNVLAFWLYSWLTFGQPPYLDLPSIGWDTYGRGGRGYLQGRIRGRNQIYFETEYRAQLRRDGLLGAVVFFNMLTTTNGESAVFGRPDKGLGLGLRMKFNKRSNTNLALDHAWGEAGSRGWFLGMTEVF